jgi:hypothetical protein
MVTFMAVSVLILFTRYARLLVSGIGSVQTCAKLHCYGASSKSMQKIWRARAI